MVQRNKPGSIITFGRTLFSSFGNFLRNKDTYGQQVQINYGGEDTFKTIPGGIISLSVTFIIYCYMVLRYISMHQTRDWGIIQQTTVAFPAEIMMAQSLSEMTNISIAVQIQPKREKQTNELLEEIMEALRENAEDDGFRRRLFHGNGTDREKAYQDITARATQYLTINGMFELKDTLSYQPFNTTLNPDPNSWKSYETVVRQNEFGLQEVVFNISDSIIKGTGDSPQYMDQVLSRFQLRFNTSLAEIHAIRSCQADEFLEDMVSYSSYKFVEDIYKGDSYKEDLKCSDVLLSMPEIVNLYLLWITEDMDAWSGPKLSAEQRIKETTEILSSQDTDQIDLFKFKFYMEVVPYKQYLMTQQLYKDFEMISEVVDIIIAKKQEAADAQASSDFTAKEQELKDTINGLITEHDETVQTMISSSIESALAEAGDITQAVSEAIDAGVENGGKIKTAIEGSITTELANGGSIKKGIEDTITTEIGDGGSIKTAIEDTITTELEDGGSIQTAIDDATARRLRAAAPTCEIDFGAEEFYVSDYQLSQILPCTTEYIKRSVSNKIIENQKLSLFLKEKRNMFTKNYDFFLKSLDEEIFQKLDFEMVIYDEIETFKNYDDPDFNYPYGQRKIKLNSQTISNIFYDYDYDTDILAQKSYPYQMNFIKFQKSTVCLESNYWMDLVGLFPQIKDFLWKIIFGIEPMPSPECGGPMFRKLKYSNQDIQTKNFLDEYAAGMINDKIMLEFSLGQDQFQTSSQRTAPRLLDWIGDVGGFLGALELALAVIGNFFSGKLFPADIANRLYIKAKTKKERKQSNKGKRVKKIQNLDQLKSLFAEIRISTINVFLDPLFNLLCPFICCINSSCRTRSKVLEKSQEKFSSELDIFNILNSIREMQSMLKHLQNSEHRELLNFSKQRVVDISDSESEDESTFSDENLLSKTFRDAIIKNMGLKKEERKELLVQDLKLEPNGMDILQGEQSEIQSQRDQVNVIEKNTNDQASHKELMQMKFYNSKAFTEDPKNEIGIYQPKSLDSSDVDEDSLEKQVSD